MNGPTNEDRERARQWLGARLASDALVAELVDEAAIEVETAPALIEPPIAPAPRPRPRHVGWRLRWLLSRG